MTAQRARMEVVTENLANSETTVTATGQPYRRKLVLLGAVDFRERTFGLDRRQAVGGSDFACGVKGLLDGEAVVEQVDRRWDDGVAQFLRELVEAGGVEEAGVAPTEHVGRQ